MTAPRESSAPAFAPCSVGHILQRMVGVWHDRLATYRLDGSPLSDDARGGQPGASPWENLVYFDFDGASYIQTNVTFRGRPLHTRTFTGTLVEGVLQYDPLGPGDPGHVGVSGGPDTLILAPHAIKDAWKRFAEPDVVRLDGDRRTRHTFLYRDGVLLRTLHVAGTRLTTDTSKRHSLDPRGPDGPVHEARSVTHVFS